MEFTITIPDTDITSANKKLFEDVINIAVQTYGYIVKKESDFIFIIEAKVTPELVQNAYDLSRIITTQHTILLLEEYYIEVKSVIDSLLLENKRLLSINI